MRFNPKHYSIHQLLEGRLFRIPEYQRAYSWTSKQRRDLFNDIEAVFDSGKDHFMATVVGLARDKKAIGADEFNSIDVVDGQQRITTIVILLKAIEIALSEEIKEEASLKERIESLLIKGDDHSLILLQTNHDSGNLLHAFLRAGTLPKKTAETTAERNLINAMNECQAFVETFKNNEELIKLLATIRNRMSVLFHEIEDEATVYKVFEVLNSRGLAVKWIDKFKSQLMALIFEHADSGAREDALNEMRNIWSSIYRTLGLKNSLGDEALKFAATLAAPNKNNRVLKEEDAVLVLIKNAGQNLSSIITVAMQLKRTVETLDKLTNNSRLSAVTQVAHARFLATAILLREADFAENNSLMDEWEKVTFRIFGLGRADSRHKVGEYVRLGYDLNKLEGKKIKRNILNLGEDYTIDDVISRGNWNLCYKNWTHELRYLLFRYDEHLAQKAGVRVDNTEWNLIWATDPSRTIEHIKPQSTSVKYIHELGNLTALPPGVNSSLGKKPPHDKAPTYIDTGIRGTRAVGTLILNKSSKKWGRKDVSARTKELLKFIRVEWSE